jgi:hypothetical protein
MSSTQSSTHTTNKKRRLSTSTEDNENEENTRQSIFTNAIQQRMKLEEERMSKLYELRKKQRQIELNEQEIQSIESIGSSTTTSIDQSSSATSTGDHSSFTVNKNTEKLNEMQTDKRIKINVGGQTFETTLTSLQKNDNIIKVIIATELTIDKDEHGAILFPDRNPEFFPIILEHIRTGRVHSIGVEKNYEKLTALKGESDYFGCSKLSERIQKLILRYKEPKLLTYQADDEEMELDDGM